MALLCLLHPAVAAASRPINVTVNGQALIMDAPPVIRNGRTLVPLRAIYEAIGAVVEWNAATRTIAGRGHGRTVILQIDNRTAIVNHTPVALDVAPALISGRTMVPLRFVAESFNLQVNWNPENMTASIIMSTPIPTPLPIPAPTPTSTPPPQQPPLAQPPAAQRQRMSPQEVTARVQPAIVRINTLRGYGSGFFVTPDGLILTNAHVVRGGGQITVTTRAGEQFTATVAKIANWHDLALLRINAPLQRSFPFLRENTAAGIVLAGEEVLAFGSPLGLAGTVTRGIVSAWQEMDVTLGAWKNDIIRVIQHDAPLAPGNSGGPLVNLYGEWVGVNTLIRADWAGFGFAVPAERYQALLRLDDYSLRCDWFSYLTEEWIWADTNRQAGILIDEALAALSVQTQVERLHQSILLMQDARQEAATYQPLYPELQNLHRLFIAYQDARVEALSYYRDVRINPALWSQSFADMLSNNFRHSGDVYTAAWNALAARF